MFERDKKIQKLKEEIKNLKQINKAHLKENGKLQRQITKQEAIIYQLKLSLNKDTGNHIPFID